jgi:ion channel-forming bestrophin family protein
VLEPLTITSFALSLLLVFRTNASYARFAEARQIWGLMLNRSRDLVRQCIAFFPASAWDEKSTFARWTMVMSKTLLCHLRTSSSLKDEVSQVLSKQEMQILLACDHPVVMTIQVSWGPACLTIVCLTAAGFSAACSVAT